MTLDQQLLSRQFDEHRPRLHAVALRVLGTRGDAEDAVQETWLRLSGTDASNVQNLGGWLTTVVGRVSLDMLRSRASRREEPSEVVLTDIESRDRASSPEDQAVLADSVGAALVVVLDTLTPAERIAFVLHDMFGVPFEDVGTVVDRSPVAAKKLASRARQKLRGAERPSWIDPVRQRAVVDAFLAAARAGEFDALVALLDPEIVMAADPVAVRMGSPETVVGPRDVAAVFSGRALGAQAARIDNAVGMAWIVDGRTRVAWDFTIVDGKIVHIAMLAAPDALGALDLTVLE